MSLLSLSNLPTLLNEDHQSTLIFYYSKVLGAYGPHTTTTMAPPHALTVDEIINRFPNHVLQKIDHKTTFEDIQVTDRLPNATAIFITSLFGGGAHGHLGIIMTRMEYTGPILMIGGPFLPRHWYSPRQRFSNCAPP
jgi:hypothetical protein